MQRSQQALLPQMVHRQPAVQLLLQWRDSCLQRMAPLDSPTTAILVRKLSAPLRLHVLSMYLGMMCIMGSKLTQYMHCRLARCKCKCGSHLCRVLL